MGKLEGRSRGSRLLEFERRLQSGALRQLGVGPEQRNEVVHGMFARERRDAVEYWTQLILSTGIATLGLALNSTAVVIGAMLIAPLMGPIVELAVGLVVASPVLTVRSLGRVVGGVGAVVGGAAGLTLLLPFTEITPEIASRTSPTALDLMIAIFVALAAALTTVRSSRATASAAAGTAIGISLIPPLCVMGYGLGIRDWDVAGGATLLFVTNLTAILCVGVLSFWVLGFEVVDTDEWDSTALAAAQPGGYMHNVLDSLHRVFGSRYGKAIRVLVPIALVGVIALPLSRALDQVAWEVRTRTIVSRIVDESTSSGTLVQSRITVGSGAVSAWLYLVGSPDEAAELERRLVERIAPATGVDPKVRVTAVPDAGALRQAAAASPAEVPTRGAAEAVIRFQEEAAAALQRVWPGEALGVVVAVGVEARDSGRIQMNVHHLGTPAGQAAQSLLGQALEERLSAPVSVRTSAYPAGPVVATPADASPWLSGFRAALRAVDNTDTVYACATVPADAPVADSARSEAARFPAGRVQVLKGTGGYRFQLSTAPCSAPGPAETAP